MRRHAHVQSLNPAMHSHALLNYKACSNIWKHCRSGAPDVGYYYTKESYIVRHGVQRCAAGGGEEPLPSSSSSSSGSSSGSFDFDANSIAIEVDPDMVDALRRWNDRYKKAVIPKSVRDGRTLSQWMSSIRRLRKSLTGEQEKELDDAGMVWSMNTVESKWFANFHILREFKEQRGITQIDEYFGHDDPKDDAWDTLVACCGGEEEDIRTGDMPIRTSELVEASRWLHRQHSLYRKQKLNAMQVHLLKRVLGVQLYRQHGPPRRNIHQRILQANQSFISQ